MKNRSILSGICILLLTAFIACKKDKTPTPGVVIAPVKVEKLSASFVQAGDELTLYGSHLIQENLVTEVFIAGRPSEMLRSSADSITVRVPPKVKTGEVMVTISNGAQFSSVSGPSIEIKPTPLIKSFSPLVAYGGETIELCTENFSDVEANNVIYLGAKKLEIVARKGKDTILVKLPADAITGQFSWHTYNGPVYTIDTVFPIRQISYAVNTVGEWLFNDPGFTYMDTLVRGFPELAPNYDIHKTIFDTALQYINSPDRKYTIFLPADTKYHQDNISKAAFIEKIKNTPFRYNSMLAGAIVPGQNMHINTMQNGDMQKTAYTMKLAYYDYPIEVDDYNFVKIIIENGVKYAQVWGPYDQTNPMVKIIREHQVGNATLIETDGELGVIFY